jgi:NADH-quinone oxidoreductase subunit G
MLSFKIRANWRHHQAHVYTVRQGPVREDKIAAEIVSVEPGGELAGLESLRERLAKEPELVVVFGDAVKGDGVRKLVEFGNSLGIPVKYVCLLDYSNSRGAVDMGLLPGPGGMALPEMLAAEDLAALWVVGANPLARQELKARNAFVVVQDLFMTETAQAADVVLPAASAYEKSGTVTNVCGEVQRLSKALSPLGAKTDLEIFGLIAREMGLDLKQLGRWTPDAVFAEIRANVHGYDVPEAVLAAGRAVQTAALDGRIAAAGRPELVRSAGDTIFTSGTLGRYSKTLTSVREAPGELYRG